MTAREARDNFADLIGAVYYGNQVVEIDKKGRTFAVVINPGEYEALKKVAKGRFFELVEEIQTVNREANPDKVLRDVSLAVEKVRQQTYEKDR